MSALSNDKCNCCALRVAEEMPALSQANNKPDAVFCIYLGEYIMHIGLQRVVRLLMERPFFNNRVLLLFKIPGNDITKITPHIT